MIWVYLTLNHAHSIIKIPKIFDKLLKLQFIIFLPAIIYGAVWLFPGTLTDELKNRILSKNGFGYSLIKWGNEKFLEIGYNGPVIILHRSVSLSKNEPISIDLLFFTDMEKQEYRNYGLYIKKLNPQYLLAPSYDNNYLNFKN